MVGEMATSKTYTIRVNVLGSDKASGPLKRFGGSLLSIRNIIGGILGANLLLALGRQIVGLGKDALNSVATYEQMGFTLQTLIARELARGKTLTRVSTQIRALTAQEKLRVMELTESQTELTISLGEVSAAYDKSVLKTGENSKASLELEIQLASLKNTIAITASELGSLSNLETVGLKTLESYTVGTMSMGEALNAAVPKARELIKWVENLAIASPFDMNGVTIALRTALAYGMNLDMAKRLTQATVDFSAASGLSGETLTRIARAMGQVQGKGRLMAEEVRQMADAGLPVLEIMAKSYGKTTIEIQALMRRGLIPANDAINAITASLEGDFAGAAERQLSTWNGIRNSMGDIKVMGLQRVFVGIADAFKPFFGDFIDFMRSEGLDRLQEFGLTFGVKFGERIEALGEKLRTISAFFTLADAGMIESALKMIGVPQFVIDSVESLETSWNSIKGWWDENKGPLGDAIGNVFSAIFEPIGGGDLGETIWDSAVGTFESLAEYFQNDNGKLVADINALAEAIRDNLHPALKNFEDWVAGHGDEIGSFFTALAGVFGTLALITGVEGVIAGVGGGLAALAATPWASILLPIAGLAAVISILYILLSGGTIEDWAAWLNVNLPILAETWNTFWTNFSDAWSAEQISADFEAIKQSIIDFSGELGKTLLNIWPSIQSAWEEGYTTFREIFDQNLLDILAHFDLQVPLWLEAGGNWAKGLLDGMRDYWVEEVWPWLEEMAQKAIELWNIIWGNQSPSTVMIESGKNIMEGLMIGLQSMENLPGIHMTNTMDSMMDPVNKIPAINNLRPASVATTNQSETTSSMTKIEKMIFDFKDTTLTKRELEKVLTQLGLLNAVG